MIDKAREEFEKWAITQKTRTKNSSTWQDLERHNVNGTYKSTPVFYAWKGFQAAYNLREQEVQRLREALGLEESKSTKLAMEVGKYRGLNVRYKKCLRLLGSIFFYGNFRAETKAEAELWAEMKDLGYAFKNEDEILSYDTEQALQQDLTNNKSELCQKN